jgi:phenylacetate-CoA ligase
VNSFELRKAATINLMNEFLTLASSEPGHLNSWILSRLGYLWKTARASNSWWHQHLPPGASLFDDFRQVEEILQRLPVLTRTMVQEASDFTAVWIPGSNRLQYGVASTSGSTGKPVKIIKHAPTYNPAVSATSLLDAVWQKRHLASPYVYLRAQGSRSGEFQINEPFNFISEVGPTHVIRSTESSTEQILDFMASLGSANVIGNATLLLALAREQIRNPRTNLNVLELMNWAEAMTPETRETLRQAFSAKISDRYSTEELGSLAIQCPESDHLHALQFFNFVEIVDEEGRPCEPGVPGRVVVTALHNFSQPLIRYEVGDIASWQEPCEHGIHLPVLSPVITRIRETIKLADGRTIQPNATGSKIAKEARVTDFQVVRFKNAILVLYIADVELADSLKNDYAEDLKKRFFTSDRVEFARVTGNLEFREFKRRDFILIDDLLPTIINAEELTHLLEKIV